MSILDANFRYDGNEGSISLEDISKHEDYEVIRENLFCSTDGCDCPLLYIPRGKYSEYLKKRNGSSHIESCMHFAPTDSNRRSRRIVGTSKSRLRDDHVASILRGLYDAYNETAEDREKRLAHDREKARQRRNNKVNTSKTENEYDEVYVNSATTSASGEALAEGERNPPVRRRYSLLDLSNNDIGETEGIIGELVEVQNDEERSILILSDKSRKRKLNVYLEQVFFENSPVNINNNLVALNELLISGREIQISCLGEVVLRNDSLGMLTLREKDLRVDRVPLGVFILNSK
ncbi:hypothetical protein [Brevibacillus porteri]|uniref:hypothetical protein n=1 Tax=Brevibacillus porteri TaxID=2126350 RepID=UPI003D20CF01